jgi:hypothetical protein
MRSGSFERGDQPRSVVDPDGDAYEEMIRRHNELVARRAAVSAPRSSTAHASPQPKPRTALDYVARGLARTFNEPREARKQLEQHHYARAFVDTATAAADLALVRSLGKGILKREFKLLPPYSWRVPPSQGQGVRPWLTAKGLAAKGQDVHHGLIPQRGWGKFIPDAIKNQPAFLRPMEEKLTHIRIHGNSRQTGLPRFKAIERYIRRTPGWWQAAHASAAGHAAQVVSNRRREDVRRPIAPAEGRK